MSVIGTVIYVVFACVMGLVLEAGLLSIVIGHAADRPLGLSVCVPIVFMAFGLDALVQVTMAYTEIGFLVSGPVSLLVWTGSIALMGQIRIGQAAMAAIALAIANKFVFGAIMFGALIVAVAPV